MRKRPSLSLEPQESAGAYPGLPKNLMGPPRVWPKLQQQHDIKLTQREPWLSKRELARVLKVSTRTIERLGLPAMRVGGQNRYLLSEVERFLSGASRRPADVVELRR